MPHHRLPINTWAAVSDAGTSLTHFTVVSELLCCFRNGFLPCPSLGRFLKTWQTIRQFPEHKPRRIPQIPCKELEGVAGIYFHLDLRASVGSACNVQIPRETTRIFAHVIRTKGHANKARTSSQPDAYQFSPPTGSASPQRPPETD